MVERIRILVADDHASFREGLVRLLSDDAELEVTAQARDGEEAVKLAANVLPDIAVVDMSMPGLNGIEVTKRIKEASPSTAVLIVSAYDCDSYVINAIRAGAAGYLLKEVRVREIARAIKSLYDGETVFASSVTDKLVKQLTKHTPNGDIKTGGELRPPQLDVLRLASRGMSNKEIADVLFISVRTVQNRFVSIFQKLGVRSRTEAVAQALQEGWLYPNNMK